MKLKKVSVQSNSHEKKKLLVFFLEQMDAYLKPDEKIEKYEKIQEAESKQAEEAVKRKKKRRRIRAKNFKPERILLHITHTRDGQPRKFKTQKCVIL